jgi:hypothetical protein
MGVLRRSKGARTDWKNVQCRPIDFQSWITSRGEQAPQDGRYYLAVMVHRDGGWCLISEGPATRAEAEVALQALAEDYGKAPQRMNGPHFDDLDGCWSAHQFGRPEAAIQIMHPRQIALFKEMVPQEDLSRAHGMARPLEPAESV